MRQVGTGSSAQVEAERSSCSLAEEEERRTSKLEAGGENEETHVLMASICPWGNGQ